MFSVWCTMSFWINYITTLLVVLTLVLSWQYCKKSAYLPVLDRLLFHPENNGAVTPQCLPETPYNFAGEIINNYQLKGEWFYVWCIQRLAASHRCWYKSSRVFPFYPFHPNISMHFLHTVLHTFPKMLTRRTCLTVKSSFWWWSFPLFMWPYSVIQGWYCKEKFWSLWRVKR